MLHAALAATPQLPTLLAMHHPPRAASSAPREGSTGTRSARPGLGDRDRGRLSENCHTRTTLCDGITGASGSGKRRRAYRWSQAATGRSRTVGRNLIVSPSHRQIIFRRPRGIAKAHSAAPFDGPTARIQSCAPRRAATIGVIQMSPMRWRAPRERSAKAIVQEPRAFRPRRATDSDHGTSPPRRDQGRATCGYAPVFRYPSKEQ